MAENLTQLLSKQDSITLLELIQESLLCETEEQMKALVEGMKTLLPFDVAVCCLSTSDIMLDKIVSPVTDFCRLINVSYPQEWLNIYLERDYYLVDPVVLENFSTFGVQYWHDSYKKHRSSRSFIALAEDFNLKKGYACGMMDPFRKNASLVSISGDMAAHPRHKAVLDLLTPHLHRGLTHVCDRSEECRQNAVLSRREQEVLIWISEGKSAWEISVILGISERTVKFHTTAIMSKLGAANRAHAVAIGLSSGVISSGSS